MSNLSMSWKLVAAIGQGVLASLALTGLVKIACRLLGTQVPDSVGGTLFLVNSGLAGGLSVYLYSRSLKPAEPVSAPE